MKDSLPFKAIIVTILGIIAFLTFLYLFITTMAKAGGGWLIAVIVIVILLIALFKGK